MTSNYNSVHELDSETKVTFYYCSLFPYRLLLLLIVRKMIFLHLIFLLLQITSLDYLCDRGILVK